MLLSNSPLALVRTDAVFQIERTAVLRRFLLSVYMGPAVASFPNGRRCHRHTSLTSASEAAALLQGEADGRPGAVGPL